MLFRSHLFDAATLRIITGLSSASAIAARLRQLETQGSAILDAALAAKDGKLALAALREIRATLTSIGALASTLGTPAQNEERPDLDRAIADYVGHASEDDARAETHETRALGAGEPPNE